MARFRVGSATPDTSPAPACRSQSGRAVRHATGFTAPLALRRSPRRIVAHAARSRGGCCAGRASVRNGSPVFASIPPPETRIAVGACREHASPSSHGATPVPSAARERSVRRAVVEPVSHIPPRYETLRGVAPTGTSPTPFDETCTDRFVSYTTSRPVRWPLVAKRSFAGPGHTTAGRRSALSASCESTSACSFRSARRCGLGPARPPWFRRPPRLHRIGNVMRPMNPAARREASARHSSVE